MRLVEKLVSGLFNQGQKHFEKLVVGHIGEVGMLCDGIVGVVIRCERNCYFIKLIFSKLILCSIYKNIMALKNQYKTTEEDFREAITSSKNIAEVLRKLGYYPKGRNYDNFIKRANLLNIDVSHLNHADGKYIRDQAEIRLLLSPSDIRRAVANNISRQSSLRTLSLKVEIGSNVSWIDRKIRELGIDTSHWLGEAHLKGRRQPKAIPLENLLVEGVKTKIYPIKSRLIKEGIWEYKCVWCGISEWQGEHITLQMDHINGNRKDNRLENLRLLCPNCHSQTETFCKRKELLVGKDIKY